MGITANCEKMYVTRLLSTYQRDPSALSLPPPEGPNSGILVIQDEEARSTALFGLCYNDQLKDMPFPQNKNLNVRYSTGSGKRQITYIAHVAFIPVLNQPLSSNQYYCIERKGKHKGEAYRCSKEEDKTTCCFCRHISDLEPGSFYAQDIYQRFEIQRSNWGGYAAKSIVPDDGFPPQFLRRKGWTACTTSALEFELTEAAGLNTTLRARLPDFNNFPLSEKNSPAVVVGKWYCPFMFIKEGSVKEQMDSSRYYVMTLEQQWEQIFCSENHGSEGKGVNVDVVTESEAIEVYGKQAMNGEKKNVINGVVWFKSSDNLGVGLSLEVVERMKWEEERFGWSGGNQKEMRVKRVEEIEGKWKKLGCYVLVERFALKRMNGSSVLTYGFRHPQHIRNKWE